MAESAKVDGRTRRSRDTRLRIVQAAHQLFVEHGFAATTVAAIASRAEVSVPTVYYSFGSKEAVLVRALDVAIAGDDEPVATLQRSWATQVLDEPDPRSQLRLMVRGAGEILARAGELLAVLQHSSALSDELASTWRENIRQRRAVQAAFAEALLAKPGCKPELQAAEVADILAVHLGPESYGLLVRELGWTHERWREYTERSLTCNLLR